MTPIIDPQAVALEFWRRIGLRDPQAFELVADDFRQHAAGPQGREGLRETATALENDLADLSANIHQVIAQGELVVLRMDLVGKHVASTMPLLRDVPVTDRELTWSFIHIFRVADGLIVEHWACRDDLGVLFQLGVWPPAQTSSLTSDHPSVPPTGG